MDDVLIAPWERLAASRAEMAAAEGISVRTLQRRMAADREKAGELLRRLDRFDHVYMEITAGAPPEGAEHACISMTGQANRDGGTYHVGGQIRNLNGGPRVAADKPEPSKHKFQPKRPKRKRMTKS